MHRGRVLERHFFGLFRGKSLTVRCDSMVWMSAESNAMRETKCMLVEINVRRRCLIGSLRVTGMSVEGSRDLGVSPALRNAGYDTSIFI